MDTLSFHYSTSLFKDLDNQQFWDPSLSWTNKYEDPDHPEDGGERFPLASTSLVFLTDGWHLFKFLTLSFLYLTAISMARGFVAFGSEGGGEHEMMGDGGTTITGNKRKVAKRHYVFAFLSFKFLFGIVFELFWTKVWAI
jgi:hypothetical protein